ncbi:hypothetical protein B1C78_04985 [Thioalkalivibrio denitrificans]|uniref:Novel STAND NTPase 5 domain-containing protein n=1 Tax=Thioalkalivibrio denitrificans TaxID=108003 RepID=A0A1V3NN91_9GAMM|nr:ATP-binding protein [Thioalkalivibrio denitrificans]OOG26423.1 hypothetical protein B1C78_04985 [Thioalkalivibrio denitrificans]
MKEIVSLQQLLSELRRFPALVVGPGVTSNSGISNDIVDAILREFADEFEKDASVSNYLDLVDSVADPESSEIPHIDECIRKHVLSIPGAPQIRQLLRVDWSTIVSLTPDVCLEDALRERLEGTATSRTLTLVDCARVLPQFRTTPIYRLLGNPRSKNAESGLVTRQSDLLIRQQSWPDMLRSFADFTKEAPVLIVGNEVNQDLVERFFAALVSLPSPRPRIFVHLKGDPVGTNRVISNLLRGKADLIEVDCTLKEFCQAIEDYVQKPEQLVLRLSDELAPCKDRVSKALTKIKSIVSVVPGDLPEQFDVASRHHQLLDGLFRPTSLDWSPFLADLHLPRTQSHELAQSIHLRLGVTDLTRMHCFILRGEAGTGKTCVMKEVAVILARKGYLVLWINRLPIDSAPQLVRDLARTLADITSKGRKEAAPKIVVLCDEPLSSRITPFDLAYEINASGAPVALVFSCRNTDFISESGVSIPLPVVPDEEVELSVELDQGEQERLPDVLIKIGAASDRESAIKSMRELSTRNSADILCQLWFLIPVTRSAITMSLEDEYIGLAEVERGIAALAEDGGRISAQARLAYECAAVCSDFKLGIPTEVLVRALEISFSEWIDMCLDGKPLWGLLYPEEHVNTGETVYWTRNDVVTAVLMRVLNGGLGHTGEVRVLRQLIKACSTGTDVYRTFLVDLLVRNRKKLGERYSLEQGIELFELARKSLPFPDRTIEHQYGLWLKDKGADLSSAYDQLQKALVAPDYPAAASSERLEHIHTSLAATVVSQARDGHRPLESAFAEVQEHLRHAQSPSFFNPHTTHVFGTLLLDLAQMHADETETETQLQAVAEALPAIERTFQIIGAIGKKARRFDKDIEMLSVLQQRLLDSMDTDRVKGIAVEIFESNRNQIGFAVVARKLLLEASKRGKGKDYRAAKEYLDECVERLTTAGVKPSDRLLAARVDLYIRWQLQGQGGSVDWQNILSDLETICASPLFRDDVIKLFYYGVVLFHLDRIPEANVIFSRLRNTASLPKLKGDARSYLLGGGGSPKRLQGVLRKSHDRWYVEVPELGTDLPLRNGEGALVNGRDIHCYVGFSFLGPFAIQQRPDPNDLLLPA